MTALASLAAAQHHDPVLDSAALVAAFAVLVAALGIVAALWPKRHDPTPPSPTVTVQPQIQVAPTQQIPCITTLPERPVARSMDDTFVMHRVVPVFDPRDTPTVVIPRQRGARHAR